MLVDIIKGEQVLKHTNIYQTTQTQVKVDEPKINEPTMLNLGIACGTAVGLAVVWATYFVLLSKMRTTAANKIMLAVNPLHKIPCKNCHFFYRSHYLKCAVQPSIVLTSEAKTCSDYIPKKG